MASEPFFEERSDAVKMSETPYPTNGSGKNPAKDRRFKYSDLCTQTCPYRLAGSALPGQRRSVSLRFRVAMLLKTQFACHRIRGKQRLRKKNSCFLYEQKQRIRNDSHKKAVLADLNQREKNTNISRPRLSGKVAAIAVGRGKYEQKLKN